MQAMEPQADLTPPKLTVVLFMTTHDFQLKLVVVVVTLQMELVVQVVDI